jgi:hypothetical protein
LGEVSASASPEGVSGTKSADTAAASCAATAGGGGGAGGGVGRDACLWKGRLAFVVGDPNGLLGVEHGECSNGADDMRLIADVDGGGDDAKAGLAPAAAATAAAERPALPAALACAATSAHSEARSEALSPRATCGSSRPSKRSVKAARRAAI